MGLVWFILVLGAIILVHEFGHFIFSKLFGVYVYEFSLGMGPKILHYKKKGGETEYCLRLIPIGGFVSLAGEDADDNSKLPDDRKLFNKPVWQRLIIMIAGAAFNFIFAFVVLFMMALIYGSVSTKPVVSSVSENYPAYEAGIKKGDTIKEINGERTSSWGEVQLYISMSDGKTIEFIIEDINGNEKEVLVTPKVEEDENGNKSYLVGIGLDSTKKRGLKNSVTYAFETMGSLFGLMFTTLKQLFTGGVGLKDLSGPVGIYKVVSEEAKQGFENLLYLTAYLSVNVGVINLIPFPAFDGGRVLFLIIEKIIGKRIPAKVEGLVNTIGFCILILLMLIVTAGDIIRLF